jgi:hypothetical protein
VTSTNFVSKVTVVEADWLNYVDANVYGVKSYGAVGDGVTDDTAAIQSAIDAIDNDGVLYFPVGTYLTGALTFPVDGFYCVGQTIKGNVAGTDHTTIKANAEGINVFSPETGAGSTVSSPIFKDITIAGASSSDITTKCISIDNTYSGYSMTLENVAFKDCAFGVHAINMYANQFRQVHGWNCATAITYSGDGPSNVYENCRCGKVPSGSATTITAITKANPAVVTAASHGLSDDDIVWIQDAGGMTEVNNKIYIVDNSTTNTFELKGIDSSSFTAYTSAGTARKTGVGYWSLGPNDLVLNSDTSADASGVGSVMWVIGESSELTLSGGSITSHVQYDSAHFEGTQGAFIWVTTGSSFVTNSCHFVTGTVSFPRAIYIDYIDNVCNVNHNLFTTKDSGTYTTNIEIVQREKNAGSLIIVPRSLDDIPSYSGAEDGFVYYEVGNYGFSARESVDQTITTNNETKLILGTEIHDTANMHNISTGDITPTVPGFYSITGNIHYEAGVANKFYEVRLKVDSTETQRVRVHASATDGISVPISFADFWLDGTETVELFVFHNAGVDADVDAGFKTHVAMSKR